MSVFQLLTVKEVAQHLRVSATCVYQLVTSGKLICHRIGVGRGSIRISENDLTEFLEQSRPSQSEKPNRRRRPKLRHLKL